MGIVASLSSRAGAAQTPELFASPTERAAFERIVGERPAPRDDPAYDTVLSAKPLTQLTQRQVELLSREYAATLAQNSLRSGNFRVLLRIVIHALPLSCRLDALPPEEAEALELASSEQGASRAKKSIDARVAEALNALYLVRSFAMRFVERQDECPLLSQFNQLAPMVDYNAIASPQYKTSSVINMDMTRPSSDGTTTASDELASKFLDALVSVLVDYRPTQRTYELHVEVLNTLIVLLASVAFPRDRSGSAQESGQNPFLHMLMASSVPDAARVVRRLLQNYIDNDAAPLTAKDTGSYQVALQNAQTTSLVKISEASDSQADDSDAFSYLTLEGVGALASTIFKFPVNFYNFFVATGDGAYPLRDRSALVLLILLQSCRDSDSPSNNPFRSALAVLADSDEGAAAQGDVSSTSSTQIYSPDDVSYTSLFAAIGKNAPYESSHLLLYSLLYTNPSMLRWAVASREVNSVLLPLLETLYHAKSVEPSRLYMLVIVLLTYTQDAAFVAAAHTKVMVRDVPWYSERYMLDVSLGSLMMVIFTRLILRNITSLQDSFIHLNAFAALSNLARAAENLHVYAAQSVVGLIALLAKKEAKLVTQMAAISSTSAPSDEAAASELEMLSQKRTAYVEFVRLLLGIVSSCLKARLLPRNPQLIYSLLYHADAFKALETHPEFAFHVHNGPVWSALARFKGVVETKTAAEEPGGERGVLDVETVLGIIRAECVSLLASASATSTAGGPASRRGAGPLSPSAEDDEACYRYEEESDPEQFFVPYIWRIVFEQTPELSWKADKITLFVPAAALVE